MRTFSLLAASAFTVVLTNALAQVPSIVPNASIPSSSDTDLVTVTSYYSSCSTLSGSQLAGSPYTGTVTGTITDTIPCKGCQRTSQPGIWTTYTTAYVALCSTGVTTSTYTITESCSQANQPRPSTYVPSGFTVTTVGCSVCKSQPTVTLTTPCASSISPPPATNIGLVPPPATTKPAPPASGTPPAPAPPSPPPPATIPSPPPASTPSVPRPPTTPNTTTTGCRGGCVSNSTYPPIAIGRASSTSFSSGIVVAVWTVMAIPFFAL